MTMAGSACHVIGAGLEAGGSARAVFVLLPQRSLPATASLQSWPSWAHRTMRLPAHVDAQPGSGGSVKHWPIVKRGYQPDDAELSGLDRLWSRLLTAAHDWEGLLDAFSGKGVATRTTAIVPLPTAEAGLAIPLERGRRLLEALAQPDSTLLARAPARPAPSAMLALGRPWLGEAGALPRLASLQPATLTDAERGLLFGPPPVAEWARAQAEGDAEGRRAGDLAYAAPLDPAALARAALSDGRDMLDVFDRMNALHHSFVVDSGIAAKTPPPDPATRMVTQLLASPPLMRLFGLAFDVELDLDGDADGSWSLSLPDRPGPACAVKLDRTAATRGFYPASRSEWEGRDKPDAETNGVALLSASSVSPEFGLITLEPALAASADTAAQVGGKADADLGQAPAATVFSGGLALVRLSGMDPARANTPAVLCSEDLRIFDRLDVGVVTPDNAVTWRCAMHRTVTLADPLKQVDVEGLLAKLLPACALPRYELDAAPSTRVKIECETQTYRDGRLAIFNGLPGGAPVNEIWWDHGTPKWAHQQSLPPDTNLALDQAVTVPSGQVDAALPPLRFGWQYRVGLRRVWMGGVTRPLAEAAALYRGVAGACLPGAGEDGRLYLRHEPVHPPSVLLPPSVPPLQPGSPHEDTLQSADQAVVVTWPSTPPAGHRDLQATARVLFPPSVSLEFAAQHEMFDGPVALMHQTLHATPAPGRDDKTGPSKQIDLHVPVDGLRHVAFRGASDRGEMPHFALLAPGHTAVRPMPYYPDPAACFLAVGLRDVASNDWVVPPKLIRVRDDGPADQDMHWPNLLPVHVELRAAAPGVRRLTVSDSPSFLSWPAHTLPAPAMRCQTVLVELGPGEQVALMGWYVPSLDDLAAWFDLCASAGELAVTASRAEAPDAHDRCASGLQHLLGIDACARLDRNAKEAPRRQVASLLWARLAEEPVEAIAAVRRIALLHAVRDAAFAPAPVDDSPLRLVRRLDTSKKAVTAFLRNALGAQGDEDGAVQPVLRGSLRIDLATTSGLQVEAAMAAPYGNLDHGSPTDDSDLVPLAPPPPPQKAFVVKPDGTPDLAALAGTVRLLTLDNIPVPAAGAATDTSPQTISLDALQAAFGDKLEAGFRNKGHPRLEYVALQVDRGTPLANGGARKVTLRVTSLPRHARMLDAVVKEPKVLTMAETWLNATIRPAEPDVKAMVPLFDWEVGQSGGMPGEPMIWTRTRSTGLRLELRRPWFSAGEGEELGIVIWPPVLPLGADGQLAPLPDQKTLERLLEDDIGPLGPYVSAWARDPLRDAEVKDAPRRFPMQREHFDVPHTQWSDAVLVPVSGGQIESGLEGEAVASLLRLVPVYDPVEDLWRADLRFARDVAAALTDRFVRLGLVRYQPNARADRRDGTGLRGIRCSPPVPAWSVLPPHRRLRVTLQAAPGTKQVSLVTVALWGPGDAPRERPLPRSIVTVALIEVGNGTEHVKYREFPTAKNTPLPDRDRGLIWSSAFRLECAPHEVLSRYAVSVEERDSMPSAHAVKVDDVGQHPDDGAVRYFSRIDLLYHR